MQLILILATIFIYYDKQTLEMIYRPNPVLPLFVKSDTEITAIMFLLEHQLFICQNQKMPNCCIHLSSLIY